MSYSFQNTRRSQNKQERFHSRSISTKRNYHDNSSQKNTSRNFQNGFRQEKGGQVASRYQKRFEKQTPNQKQINHQQSSKKIKNNSNQTSNQRNKNFSDSTQPRKSNQKKSQELQIKKPFQEQKKEIRTPPQLPETQNMNSSNILGKREYEQEDSAIKANIELEIEEIEQSTLKKKIKIEELESVKTADSISTLSEPNTNIINSNTQKIRKINEAFSGLKQKVEELENDLSPETKENMQKILDKNSELSFIERFSNVMNFFQTFDLKKLH